VTPLRSVVLAGGGTGGHIEPALAFAECLRRHDPDIRITCLGTPKGLEAEIIPARGWHLELVPAYPLPRRPGAELLRTPGRMARAMRATRSVLDRVEADAVVGFGGYVAVPAYLAAWRRGTPIVVHEKDMPPGFGNRLGARLTPYVGLGFPHQNGVSGRLVGVPLRRAIATLHRPARRAEARAFFGLDPDRRTLLVTGGSQGARRVNTAVTDAAADLAAAGIQVLHVAGPKQADAVRAELGPSAPVTHHVVAYVDAMELAYAAADLALCRAGAMTCAELAAVGLPAVYVPLPIGNGEQALNARPIVDAGGGLLVEDAALDAAWIRRHVVPLLSDPTRIAGMSARAAALGHRDADVALARLVLQAAGQPTASS
jgi:UDP-N-acetylglucosamine--N-acetylmuramyl-(pentapeptide) pyrophosphoryl-undecaprenol N-acetylglucosamine transferase